MIRRDDGRPAATTSAAWRGSGVVLVSNSTGQMKLYRVVDPAPATNKRVAVGTLEGAWTLDGVERTSLLASLY
ncbi:hypothetical protein [Propioniciclava tarda]|uniref:Uncharacterized protein n=1 Tax=Propioniciclava tarda TaxID=433330 RepID=A0A4V2JT41_PROTD|nr:hypothetical protein [Propioniciclava tarda]TBT94771.1 hypothetical protein ET996_09265 [Propioniciclava tarda]SMO64310.1 hypothetical protein SAMN06266982_1106 [Propioniciclava tarda]